MHILSRRGGTMHNVYKEKLRLVSFDGGGPKSFSQLEIMNVIMHQLGWDPRGEVGAEVMLPCEHYDLIGGSDTGGLIAIMFSRLKMSIKDVISEFDTIVEQVYASDLQPTERAARLKQYMEALLIRRNMPIDAKLRDDQRNVRCKGFALAAFRINVGNKVYLRTYSVQRQPASDITIVDAVLATCVSNPTFPPVLFGAGFRRQEYIGAGHTANNPVNYVITEAKLLFGQNSSVSSLLSLGSGHPGILTTFRGSDTDAIHQLVSEMMLDCEQRAQEIQHQIGYTGIYFRFSVEQGMQRGFYTQINELGWIAAQTQSYIQQITVSEKIDEYVQSMKEGSREIALNRLNLVGGAASVLSGETRHPRAPTEDDSEDDNVSEASWFTAPSQSPLSPQVSQLTAPLGMCRELCSLVRENGDRLCTRKCTFDRRTPHKIHTCDHSTSCPMKCQLCRSYCSTEDHFHALQPDAVHLCGQMHSCPHLCELDGICEIKTMPLAVENIFVGKYESFSYTKYVQQARRLPCCVSLAPNQLKHEGRHVHSNEHYLFHYCKEKCEQCGYYCTLPMGHSQYEHETSHGSMTLTKWVIEGDDHTSKELQGHKYATGDSGVTMLCSLVCSMLGRHVHIDPCRSGNDESCSGAGVEHIHGFDEGNGKDWITHELLWARSGFKDPYSRSQQEEFKSCDYRCSGEEHDDTRPGGVVSYCILPLFHGPPKPNDIPPLGYISNDGHVYKCQNPALMQQQALHIFFVLDHGRSMQATDCKPLPSSSATQRILRQANNRFGAALSSLYGFWTATDAIVRVGFNVGQRRDAYSIICFNHNASVIVSNDTTSSPDQLLDRILRAVNAYGGTNYTAALETVQRSMEVTWKAGRYPIIIFISDGNGQVSDIAIYNLCRSAARLGKPLAFHSVAFGQEARSGPLRRMVEIAQEVYNATPSHATPGENQCSFSYALDTIQLAVALWSVAQSVRNPRAALSRV